MKQGLLLLFFFVVTTAFAQTKKFSVGVSGAPLWARCLRTNTSIIRDKLQGGFGFQPGLFSEYAFSSRLSLRVGVGYLEVPYDNPKRALVFGQPEPNQPEFGAIEIDDQFLSIPMLLKFYLGETQKWYSIVGTGIWIPVGIKQKVTLWYSDGSVTTNSARSNPIGVPTLLNSSVGFGYEFHLTPKIHFFLEPTATLTLGSFSGWNVGLRPYTAGLNTGVRF